MEHQQEVVSTAPCGGRSRRGGVESWAGCLQSVVVGLQLFVDGEVFWFHRSRGVTKVVGNVIVSIHFNSGEIN